MRGMDTLGNFEIYVPREAEVKTVPIESLRLSVQQRIGFKRSRCGHKSSSTSVIWISPVVIRERVRSPNKLDTSDMVKYNMASAVIQDRKTISSPCYMAFVTSNCVALRVLGEFLEVNGNGKGRIPAQTSPLPHGTATRCPKDAIIIHHRRIFLSLRPIRGSRWHLETTPAQTLKSQKMSVFESPAVSEKQTCHPVAPDAACDDARRERAFLRRFGVTRFIQVTLSRLPSQYLTHLPSTPQQSKRENLHTSDVFCSRTVCVLYSVLWLACLPTPTKSEKPRCGTELMSDLLFVCGDRGIHIGKPAGFRSRYRLREHRIVDQCCLKGCSLNYMETYCAKPRSRRYIAPSPQQVTDQQFRIVFHRRLTKHLETAKGIHRQTQERVENSNQQERRHRSSTPADRHRENLTSSSPTL